VETPIIYTIGPILITVNSGTDAQAATSHHDKVIDKMPTAQGELTIAKLRDKEPLAVTEFRTTHKKHELITDMEITEPSIKRKLNRKTADNSKLFTKLDSPHK
jgi:hypothetical protein